MRIVFLICSGFILSLSSYSFGQGTPNYCRTEPVRTDVLDFPSKHAWNWFVKLNHPALPKSIARGVADCSLPIGALGTTSVWETWRNSNTEVFMQDGSEPPAWDDLSLPDSAPGTVTSHSSKKELKSLNESEKKALISFHDATSIVIQPNFDPVSGVFVGHGAFGETRMNRPTYDFIKHNCLWSKDGLKRYAQAYINQKKPKIVFPNDSVEVKAAWLDLKREKIPEEKWSSYYLAEHEGVKYGLTTFQFLTKDIPNWFWATFHHRDAPDNEFEVPDEHGLPKDLLGTIWENYELGGTQTDFVSPSGKPSILSDHYVEFGFQRSSCIACHANATISPDGSDGPTEKMSICIMSPDVFPDECKTLIGENLFRPGTNELWHEYGTPFGDWFEKDGDPFHLQTDFIWSLITDSRSEQSAPPKRCEF